MIYGGDFTGSISFRLTPNNDHFEGTSESESMIGGLGYGGEDVLYGGPGDDILSITDSTFFRIDGGPGYDTLRLDGSNMHLDLSKIPELTLQNIEAIELHGQGNQLTLEVRDIVANSDTTNTLVIYGKAENTVSADFTSTGFKNNGAIIDGGKFIEYRSGNGGGPLKSWIQADITRNITVD